MYEAYYQLTEKPFQVVPNPSYFFLSQTHEHALTHLKYGITENTGFICLTGDVGLGKTLLLRHLLDVLDMEILRGLTILSVYHTNVTFDVFLNLILMQIGLKPVFNDRVARIEAFNQFLAKNHEAGKRVVLIIDEAQNLTETVIEDIRMLANLQSDAQVYLQILFAGQPRFLQLLKQPSLMQLRQRITVNYHLAFLTHAETTAFIEFRLRQAGRPLPLFSTDAVDAIYGVTKGNPRHINQICDAALVYGFADEKERIDGRVIAQVVADMAAIWRYENTESLNKDIVSEIEALKQNVLFERKMGKRLAHENKQLIVGIDALEKKMRGKIGDL